jgi:hypothetical protein
MIKVVQTSTPGTLIHTAHASALDEIVLSAVNSDTADHKLTIEFGGVGVPDDLIEITIPPESGLIFVIPQEAHMVLTNSLVVRAFADAANVVMVGGCINRITN